MTTRALTGGGDVIGVGGCGHPARGHTWQSRRSHVDAWTLPLASVLFRLSAGQVGTGRSRQVSNKERRLVSDMCHLDHALLDLARFVDNPSLCKRCCVRINLAMTPAHMPLTGFDLMSRWLITSTIFPDCLDLLSTTLLSPLEALCPVVLTRFGHRRMKWPARLVRQILADSILI
jgi:hypothetical protein